jgi:hypothetical protein
MFSRTPFFDFGGTKKVFVLPDGRQRPPEKGHTNPFLHFRALASLTGLDLKVPFHLSVSYRLVL